MNEAQTKHMNAIAELTSRRIKQKYERGQSEHGWNLWERPVFRDLIDEATDLNTYIVTLESQLRLMHEEMLLARRALNAGLWAEVGWRLDNLDTAFRLQLPPSPS